MKRTLLVLGLFLACLIPVPARADTGITDIALIGPGGTGGTTTIPTSGASTVILGTSAGGTANWRAQSFSVSTGTLDTITIPFGANNGSPTGTVTYFVTTTNVSIPGTTLASGTFTPTASANNVLNLSSANQFLTSGVTYWLYLKPTSVQSTSVSWTLKTNTSDLYSDGMLATTGDGGATWSLIVADDLQLVISTTAGSAPLSTLNDKLAQSFSVSQPTTISAVSLNLKKVGAPTGTLTLSLESDAGQMPSGHEAITGATVTKAESSLTTSYAETAFTLSSPVLLRPGVLYWWNLTTDRTDSTVYVVWGATGTCTGQWFRNHVNGAWQLEQNIATYQLTIDSVSQPASQDFVTLTSGTTGTVDYSVNAGQAAEFGLGIIILIVLIFGIFRLKR